MRNTLRNSPKKISHFFLGSSEENLSALIFNIKQMNPSINIAGYYSPKFGIEWQIEIGKWEKLISDCKPNVVWVGMGAPKQFLISSRLKNNLKISSVSVGAAFDFLAETKPEAPIFIQKIGFEWFYRFLKEPHRLFTRYLIGNFYFLLLLGIDVTLTLKSKLTKA